MVGTDESMKDDEQLVSVTSKVMRTGVNQEMMSTIPAFSWSKILSGFPSALINLHHKTPRFVYI